MAAFSFSLSTSPQPIRHFKRLTISPSISSLPSRSTKIRNKSLPLRTASISASSADDFSASNQNSRSKKSVLSNLIQEIEPLDVSLIQKDVPPTTIDAMKRTISGMLGLLPSDQFQVLIEALWEPISKLLISSMMTGYTLRNAEYRLCLEKNIEIYDGNIGRQKPEDSKVGDEKLLNENISSKKSEQKQPTSEGKSELSRDIPDFGKMTPEAQQYILDLQTRLASYKKELREVKRKSAALQMQQFVGEEKNELLDYLRSLLPEKVAELSEPTSLEVKETIRSVVHGLLATLSPRMHSKAPDLSENNSAGTVNVGAEDSIDLVENTSIHFQPQISLTRDYLARLLFWCMLLGHYLRGLEYRVELTELLSLPCGLKNEGRIKETISNLPVATEDDDGEEAAALIEKSEAANEDAAQTEDKEESDPFGLDDLIPSTSKKDDRSKGKRVTSTKARKGQEEEETKRFLRSQREALISCLEIAANRYKTPWCQTSIDILVKHAFDNISRFTSRQRDAIEKLWASVREQQVRRKQGKSVSGKLDVNAFEHLQEKYANEKISIRRAVGGSGDRKCQQWLG